ncbi:DUF2085 domain-containing protein [Tengunoibacter tsumagoiensis]|uniref:DUF2085 domain-containing protein n=1 Tax=Tengunoibacter tsumagoiensis TaxID=2014871 RepID=A0A401ZZ56_9CHLR|nr:DUF2085 domain-containing protein [Tengunoibacter tsumagoiensis]GCE12130.1 hypothetical protein KTT_19890 [Tengunoibacter tsumagoiensis]
MWMSRSAGSQRYLKAPRWLLLSTMGVYLVLAGLLVWSHESSLLNALRWLDSGICAQILTHSFYPGGERLPLCARNTGIYLGAFLSGLILYASGHGRAQLLPPRPILVVLLLGVLMMAVDGTNSFLLDLGLIHLYQPQNPFRLATGLLAGLALGSLSLPILNQFLWCDLHEQRSISSWSHLCLFLPALLLCFFAICAQNSVILYPIAIFSSLGLILTMGCFNLLLLLTVCRREQQFVAYRELFPFVGLAIGCAIGELLLLAQGKMWLLHLSGLS